MKKSLSTRLMYSFMALIVIIIMGVIIGVSSLITDYFFEEKEKELNLKGREVAITVAYFMNIENDTSLLNRYLSSMDRLVGARIWLFDNNFELVAASTTQDRLSADSDLKADFNRLKQRIYEESSELRYADNNTNNEQRGVPMGNIRELLTAVYDGKTVNSRIFHPYYKEQVLLVGVPITSMGGKLDGAMLMATPISGLTEFMKNVYLYTALVGLVAVVLSLFMVRRLSRTIVKPLVSMRDTASALADGDYSRKVEVKGQDEVAELGNSLNALANDLAEFVTKTEKMEDLRRDFVANVSHELRTPITIIRGYNEAISDGMVTDKEIIAHYRMMINEETVRLERLIKELLDISSLQKRSEIYEDEEIPLGNIVKNVAEMLVVRLRERNLRVAVEVDDTILVRGSGDRLFQLVMILGDNAIKYSPDGGVVGFKFYRKDDEHAVLSVEDQGYGIPEEDIQYIWERFYKVDKSHSRNVPGTGLGLAIAKEIIRMHNATVEVSSKLGEGTCIDITFAVSGKESEQ